MEAIKKKITSLKVEIENKEDIIEELNTKLKNNSIEKSKIEEKNKLLLQKLGVLEEDFDKIEEQYLLSKKELEEVEQQRDDSDRTLKSLVDSEQTAVYKLETQTDGLKEAKINAEEAEEKYEEAARKLQMLEDDLDKCEERAEIAEARNKELNAEFQLSTGEIRSYEASECSMEEKRGNAEALIDDLTSKLAQSTEERDDAESACIQLEKDIEAEEDKLERIQCESDSAKAELDAVLQELNEI